MKLNKRPVDSNEAMTCPNNKDSIKVSLVYDRTTGFILQLKGRER